MLKGLLDPKIDFVFKKIFGSEKHPRILISFLNAIMKPECPIVKVEIKNTDIEKHFIEDKFSRLDVMAETDRGEKINIEIQLKNEYNMIRRSLYYWSKLYEEQLTEGEDYSNLKRTVCINILNFKYLKNDRFHNGYRLKEMETAEELTDAMEIHFIEIPKHKDSGKEKDMLVAWTEFLKNPESEKTRDLEMSIGEIKEAKDELVRLSNNKEERALYEMRIKILKDKVSALNNAEQEGMEKGIEKGIEKEKLEVAEKMLRKGIAAEMVIELTGLDEDKVIKIQKSIKN